MLAFRDRFLSFHEEVEARYERDTGAKRAAHLQKTIVIGLIFYNAYNLTDAFLIPDIFWLGVALRLMIITPGSLALAWAVTRVSPRVREAMVTGSMVNAMAVPIYLFWLTTDPRGPYTFGELPLTLVFGTMMLVLRFSHAVVFASLALAMTLIAIATKKAFDPNIEIAFTLQVATSTVFLLYGNYNIERSRRRAYLTAMSAILQSERSEIARQQFAVLSMTDALTGLANRRMLDASMSEWSTTPLDARASIAVLMIDIDHFKIFNDTYGHAAGDECLQRIGQAIMAATRGDKDMAFRYGGEEFTILLRGCDEIGATCAAQRLRTAVESLGIPHRDRKDGSAIVTVSLGGAHLPSGQDCKADILFAAADRALYDAKDSGRNCYIHRRLDLLDAGLAPIAA